MEIKPFALKLAREIDKFILKGKLRSKGKRGKFTIPILPEGLPKAITPAFVTKAQALQLNQELVLSRSHLIPEFLSNLKNNIIAKIGR